MNVKLKTTEYTLYLTFYALCKETNKKVELEITVNCFDPPEIKEEKNAWALGAVKKYFPKKLLKKYVLPNDEKDVASCFFWKRKRVIFPTVEEENNE